MQAIQRKQVSNFASSTSDRDGRFKTLTEDDVSKFREIVNEADGVVTDESELRAVNTDWTNTWTGQSKLLLRPSTTEQVSLILKYCND